MKFSPSKLWGVAVFFGGNTHLVQPRFPIESMNISMDGWLAVSGFLGVFLLFEDSLEVHQTKWLVFKLIHVKDSLLLLGRSVARLVWTFWEFGFISVGEDFRNSPLMMGLEDDPFPFEVVPRHRTC